MLPSGSSNQPGDGPDTHCPPIRPCSRWGLAVAASPQTTGRSYRPISPLPSISRPSRCPLIFTGEFNGGMFLCHFPSSAFLQNPGSYPAPCPVEPGLSSLPNESKRRSPSPPDPLAGTLAYQYRWVKLRFGSVSSSVCHAKNVSLLVTPSKANVQMNGGIDSMMDSSLRRNYDNETDSLRIGGGGGWNLQYEALTPIVVTVWQAQGANLLNRALGSNWRTWTGSGGQLIWR